MSANHYSLFHTHTHVQPTCRILHHRWRHSIYPSKKFQPESNMLQIDSTVLYETEQQPLQVVLQKHSKNPNDMQVWFYRHVVMQAISSWQVYLFQERVQELKAAIAKYKEQLEHLCKYLPMAIVEWLFTWLSSSKSIPCRRIIKDKIRDHCFAGKVQHWKRKRSPCSSWTWQVAWNSTRKEKRLVVEAMKDAR